MLFRETKIPGCFLIEPDRKEDERGFFARTYCEREFAEHGLQTQFAQSSVSFNRKQGTLRGMHYQALPHAETKLVRCTSGAVYDVVLDLRLNSPTYLQWTATTLTPQNHFMLYIPEGCAHGFQTLDDSTEIYYQISACYEPAAARGVRWDDPCFAIQWPDVPRRIISVRDQSYESFEQPFAAGARG